VCVCVCVLCGARNAAKNHFLFWPRSLFGHVVWCSTVTAWWKRDKTGGDVRREEQFLCNDGWSCMVIAGHARISPRTCIIEYTA
jgi:hypothetical protein